jgi:hypothetical protein
LKLEKKILKDLTGWKKPWIEWVNIYFARLPLDSRGLAGGLATIVQMKLLEEHVVLEELVLVEVEVDAVARLDVLELLDVDLLEVLQGLLVILVEQGGQLRVVEEDGDPEGRYAADELGAVLVVWLAELVELLLDLENLLARLLVQLVDLALDAVDLLDRLLRFLVYALVGHGGGAVVGAGEFSCWRG